MVTSMFSTNRRFFLSTLFFWAAALFAHLYAHTAGFTHGYFQDPNLYNLPETGWFVSPICHSLTALAVTSTILNFALPFGLKFKWAVALIFGMVFGAGWEVMEIFVAPTMGGMIISRLDTILDLYLDFLGSILAIFIYYVVVKVPESIYNFTVEWTSDFNE